MSLDQMGADSNTLYFVRIQLSPMYNVEEDAITANSQPEGEANRGILVLWHTMLLCLGDQ